MNGGGPTLSNSQENTWISVLFLFARETKGYYRLAQIKMLDIDEGSQLFYSPC